jgi:hypothetical protein
VTRPEGDAGTPVTGWGRELGVVVWNVSQRLLAWWWCQFPVSGESIYRQGCDFRVSQPQHLAFSLRFDAKAHSNASLWLIFRVDSLGRSFPIPFFCRSTYMNRLVRRLDSKRRMYLTETEDTQAKQTKIHVSGVEF